MYQQTVYVLHCDPGISEVPSPTDLCSWDQAGHIVGHVMQHSGTRASPCMNLKKYFGWCAKRGVMLNSTLLPGFLRMATA